MNLPTPERRGDPAISTGIEGNHLECAVYRVSWQRDGAWQPILPANVDQKLVTIAMEYMDDVPPAGGFTPKDWSVVPVYCAPAVLDAVVQAFGRFSGNREGTTRLPKQFVYQHWLHVARFTGTIADNREVAAAIPGWPDPYLPGSYVGERVEEVREQLDAVEFASRHSVPHRTIVVLNPEHTLKPLSATALSQLQGDDRNGLLDGLEQIPIEIVA